MQKAMNEWYFQGIVNKVFIVYLRSLFCTGVLVVRAVKLRRDCFKFWRWPLSFQAPKTKAYS